MTAPDPTETQILTLLQQILPILQDIQIQLRGPNLTGWQQLGQDAQGGDLTLVDAVSAIEAAVGLTV